MTTYSPKPIDTSHVILSPSLLGLLEDLARNTHELWAQERIAQGWRYGVRRDDSTKQHPSLVPYEDLSEDEKRFDRNTAAGALKKAGWLLRHGYKDVTICTPAGQALSPDEFDELKPTQERSTWRKANNEAIAKPRNRRKERRR